MDLTLKKIVVTAIRQNCTVVSSQDKHAVIIDPGGESERIFQEVEGLSVDALLLTHGHLDHAGGAAHLKKLLSERQKTDIPIIGPLVDDSFLLERIEEQGQMFGVFGMESVTPDQYISDGMELHFLGQTITVAHIPGHTPGHVVYIWHDEGIVFTGDTLFRGTVGRTDFSYGDSRALLKGIEEKLFSLPDSMKVFPGHGLPTTIGYEKRHNPFFAR